jgi:glycine hydroxymethyltransferase
VHQFSLQALLDDGLARLQHDDGELYEVLTRDCLRQAHRLSLVASSSVVDPSVLVCQASAAVNVTAEGYPGRRYHAGCEVIDEIERLAVERAKQAFGARYANVQSHSATTANYTVLSSLLRPGDSLLGMQLEHGGHLTHGSPAAYAGQYFRAIGYGLNEEGRIDYDQVASLALEHRPRVIICGATSYPRVVDFARFRRIADAVGAYLVADISHVAGLVVAGLHPSPIDEAHITTTCTHKQLCGPRGGLIMCGRDLDAPSPRGETSLAEFLERAVFPFSQGAPALNAIAAKARALAFTITPEFRAAAHRIVETAGAIAERLTAFGYALVSAGTDNHIVLIDLSRTRVSGVVAERALEACYLLVNRNRVPRDPRPPLVTSGVRIGTNSVAQRGMRGVDAAACADLIHGVVSSVEPLGDRDYRLPPTVRDAVRARVAELCKRYPLPGYPSPSIDREILPTAPITPGAGADAPA